MALYVYGSANDMNKTVIGTPQCQILRNTFTVCLLPKILKLCKFVRTVFMIWQKPNQLCANMSLSWFHMKYVGLLKKPKQNSGTCQQYHNYWLTIYRYRLLFIIVCEHNTKSWNIASWLQYIINSS